MNPFAPLKGLTPPQWRAFAAAYLGWMLDAFDYFIVVMVIAEVALTAVVPVGTNVARPEERDAPALRIGP